MHTIRRSPTSRIRYVGPQGLSPTPRRSPETASRSPRYGKPGAMGESVQQLGQTPCTPGGSTAHRDRIAPRARTLSFTRLKHQAAEPTQNDCRAHAKPRIPSTPAPWRSCQRACRDTPPTATGARSACDEATPPPRRRCRCPCVAVEGLARDAARMTTSELLDAAGRRRSRGDHGWLSLRPPATQ